MRIVLTSVAVLCLLAVASGDASAQEGTAKTGVGVGVEAMLQSPPGVAASYDADIWRLDGILGFYENSFGVSDRILLAGRVMFPIHASSQADFSVGGGFGIRNYDNGIGDNETDVHVEGSAQIRAFITPNVALLTTLGLGIVLQDGDDPFVVSGNLLGSLGVIYYFY